MRRVTGDVHSKLIAHQLFPYNGTQLLHVCAEVWLSGDRC